MSQLTYGEAQRLIRSLNNDLELLKSFTNSINRELTQKWANKIIIEINRLRDMITRGELEEDEPVFH